MIKPKLYPSSVGFAAGKLNLAESNNACWRYLQLTYGVRNEIHPFWGELGSTHELNHGQTLTNAIREQPFKIELDDCVISGRCDFLLPDEVHECKATTSDAVLKGVIRDGKPKSGHLAQLVLYMGHFQRDVGRLVYGYYEQSPEGLVQVEGRTFLVQVEGGSITIDDKPSGFTVAQLGGYIAQAANWLNSETFAPRPNNSAGWDGPCRWCPLADLCETIETEGVGFQDAKKVAETALKNQVIREPKVKLTTRRRRSKNDTSTT